MLKNLIHIKYSQSLKNSLRHDTHTWYLSKK